MSIDGFVHQLPDLDPAETQEWLDSLNAVIDARGKTRARFLLSRLTELARMRQVGAPTEVSTP
jgi:pyruvate dehydrogenase E1 component